jgi:hypothetical protein
LRVNRRTPADGSSINNTVADPILGPMVPRRTARDI